MSTINTLRDALFDTLKGLQNKDKPLDIERARAICEVSSEITNTAKVEIDFLRLHPGARGTCFIADATTLPGTTPTANGSKTVALVPGGSVTTHRLK